MLITEVRKRMPVPPATGLVITLTGAEARMLHNILSQAYTDYRETRSAHGSYNDTEVMTPILTAIDAAGLL